MADLTLADVVTQLVSIAEDARLSDGFYPRVRDLDDTPISLEQGDCPQVFFHPLKNKAKRLTLDNASGTHQSQRDFTVLGYYIDTMELVPAWDSRPRVNAWCDTFVEAVNDSDDLNLTNCYAEASAEVRDALVMNGIKFRGAIITITGKFYGSA